MNCGKITSLLCGVTLSLSSLTYANLNHSLFYNKPGFHIAALYLKPNSNNLKYAVFVSGNQPLHQSWHNQMINPGYSPALELGVNYGLPQSDYTVIADWLYLNASDSNSKQAAPGTAIATVQFVAPPYDVGPAVFSIKKASSTVNNNFSSVLLNMGRLFTYAPGVEVNFFGGLNVLKLDQTLRTVFSDNAGSPIIPGQAYPLPPDPRFRFQTKNTSDYLGIGPDFGVNIQYQSPYGLGVAGQLLATLTAGSISANDNFTSTSARLLALGVATSHQAITTPNTVQVVPGLDSRLGVFFNHAWNNCVDMSIEVGYRFAYYQNIISQISPDTLVQAGLDDTIPEFATGTMAINSTTSSYSPFSMQGLYLDLEFNFA